MSLKKIFDRLFQKTSWPSEKQGGNHVPRRLPKLSMLVISDLHSCSRETMGRLITAAETESYDCALFLGDILSNNLKVLIPHMGGKPCFYVLGNHDAWHQNNGIGGLRCIDGKTVAVHNVRVSGISGSPRYKDGDWAMRTEEEVRDVLQNVGVTDILISHVSPYGLLSEHPVNCGYKAITEFLKQKDVPLHIFGHHHIDHEVITGRTREVCVYGCSLITTNPFSIRKIEIGEEGEEI